MLSIKRTRPTGTILF